jgi:hypothetical protein
MRNVTPLAITIALAIILSSLLICISYEPRGPVTSLEADGSTTKPRCGLTAMLQRLGRFLLFALPAALTPQQCRGRDSPLKRQRGLRARFTLVLLQNRTPRLFVK